MNHGPVRKPGVGGGRTRRSGRWLALLSCLALVSCEEMPGARNTAGAEGGDGNWPGSRLTLVTHSSPGGGGDVMGRELGRALERLYGGTVVVENRVGGSGAVAVIYMATRARRDGSILQIITPTHLITPLRTRGVPTHEEMTPVARLLLDPTVIFVRSSSPFQTMEALIAHAKANPGTLTWGFGSAGSLDHLVVEELKEKAEISVTSVPHEGGGDAMLSVMGGHIDVGVGEPSMILPQVRAGNLRILSVLDQQRLEQFPDVPAIGELGYAVSSQKFRGIWGPPGLPEATVDAIADALEAAYDEEPFRTYWQEGGMQRAFLRGPEFAAFLTEANESIRQFLERH